MATQDDIIANLVALGFDNVSAAGIFYKISEAAGIPVDNTITEIANSESKITNLLISQYGYGKPDYYTQAALAFQYGDDLIVNMAINPDTGAPYLNYIYAVIDESKQIIKQAAFGVTGTGNDLQLFLKVATADANGNLIPLSQAQLTAFINYFLNFQIPGLNITVISINGNIFNFQAIATYITAYDLSTLQTNTASAIVTFQDTFVFNGVLYIGDLQDYLKENVPGMKDFYVSNTTIDGAPFAGFIALPSGYFDYDQTVPNNINYNPVSS